MTLILALLKVFSKISNELFRKIIYITVRLHDIICMLSFFVLPFVKFPEKLKLVFLITWMYTCLIIWGGYLFFSYRAKDKIKGRREEYIRDKVVYWISEIGMCLCMTITFFLVFIKRNYASKVSFFEIIAFLALLVFFISALSKLFASYKNNYKQLAKDTILSLLILLCILSVAIGVTTYNTEQSLINNIFISLGAFPLAIGGLYVVCKTFLLENIESKKPDTLTLSILLFVGIGLVCGILLRYLVTDLCLQQILTTIFSSVLGGSITLAGVAWTIKDANTKRQEDLDRIEKERKEEERKKYVPFINFYTNKVFIPDHTVYVSSLNFSETSKEKKFFIDSFFLKNTDFTPFCLAGIYFNNHIAICQPAAYIDKQWIVEIRLDEHLILSEDLFALGICARDLLGNEYRIPLDYSLTVDENQNTIIILKGSYLAEHIEKKQV